MTARAVVTGANSGIGLATALRLARDGYRVTATSRGEAGLDTIAAAAAEAGVDGVEPTRMDVTDDASVVEAFAPVLAEGPVAVLVNNAGISGASSLEETPIEVYRQMWETNVAGVVRCTQQVLPGMRAAGAGRIVNLSSASAIIAPPLMSAYASTKFAVEAISESLQAEVAPFGIRVIAVQAGTIMTPIWTKAESPALDTVYPAANEFLMQVFTHNLTHTGVPAETVADVIADAVRAESPTLRHVVGDADVLDAMRRKFDDADLFDVYALEGEEFRTRYAELAGVDYWA